MIEAISGALAQLTGNDKYLTLFLLSIVPIVELRGAIIFMSGIFAKGAGSFGAMYAGMWCCIAGSTAIILPLMLAVRPLLEKFKRSKFFMKMANGVEGELKRKAESAYTSKRKHEKTYSDAKKFFGLLLFVSIPLPMTGAYTGSLVGAYLDCPIWKSALAVFLGNIIAAHALLGLTYLLPPRYADLALMAFLALAIAVVVATVFCKMVGRQIKNRRTKA